MSAQQLGKFLCSQKGYEAITAMLYAMYPYTLSVEERRQAMRQATRKVAMQWVQQHGCGQDVVEEASRLYGPF